MLRDDERYRVILGDCIEEMAAMPEKGFDFSVFSPPFPSIFAYTSSPADIGNSDNLRTEAKLHFGFFFRQLVSVMKPGRVVMVHCMQLPGLARNGEKGTFDFRGTLIRLAQRAGFTYQYDWLIHKNPQAQAIRTHAHQLLFCTLDRDRSVSRGAIGDYVVKLIAPGDNAVPINSKGVAREDWIKWAKPCWDDIRETETLNVKAARGEGDTKHICPLQLSVIERLVKLFSNEGEIVFSPFAGIGSELVTALKLNRRACGVELKPEYHAAAVRNCEAALKAAATAATPALYEMAS